MRPTRQFWTCDGKIDNKIHRIFRCFDCGNEQPWVDNPILNGAYAELHQIEPGIFSGLSMLSDPEQYPPKRRRRTK